ncbi:hypothetical protein Q0F99_14055 [Rathayibacter oskolensis]|nr:hypothetical protein [Rathayibacter oskolensis]WKK70865.1 hypothetical protein Q0F99_14055 [Rathayibacter oskolensis]
MPSTPPATASTAPSQARSIPESSSVSSSWTTSGGTTAGSCGGGGGWRTCAFGCEAGSGRWSCRIWSSGGVGSKATQPCCAKATSTHACTSSPVMATSPERSAPAAG